MSKLLILVLATLLVCSLATDGATVTISTTSTTSTTNANDPTNTTASNPKIPTPIVVPTGTEITLSLVFPSIDTYLRNTFWYYLKGADIFYQANVNTRDSFLYFVIYRNIVGTFLVITTWDRTAQTSQVNTFVRLGNGYATGSGALYDPVKVNPLVLSLQLGEGEFMVTINSDGTVTVVGEKRSKSDIEKDMDEKLGLFNTFVSQKYWYYLNGAKVINASHTLTSQRYYYVNIYINTVGTFLVIGNYECSSGQSNINTFVRLGNGFDISGITTIDDVQEISLCPAVLEMTNFGQ